MKTIVRVAASLLVGMLAFLVTLVVTTELLTPHVWPALVVSIPIGLVAGVVGVGLSLLGLRYREEKAANGRASRRTVSLLGGFGAGTAGFVVAGAATTAVLGALATGLLTAMLLGGFPAGALVGLWTGYLVARRLGRREAGGGRNDGDSVHS